MGQNSGWHDRHPDVDSSWQADVEFPVSRLPERDALFSRVERLADQFGGRVGGSSQPTPENIGRPGFGTFGMSVDFEPGDVNARSFLRFAERELAPFGGKATCEDLRRADDDDDRGR